MGVGGCWSWCWDQSWRRDQPDASFGGLSKEGSGRGGTSTAQPQIQGGRGATVARGRGSREILEAGPVVPAPQEENKARYGF